MSNFTNGTGMAAPSNTTLSGAPLVQLAAPLLLGYMLNWGLYGALSVQVYLYFLSFSNDRISSKALVTAIYLWESAQTLVATHDAFDDLGAGFGNVDQLDATQWLWFSVPIMSGVVSCTVQCFYAWRLYAISHSPFLAVAIVLLAFTGAIAAIIMGNEALKSWVLSALPTSALKTDVLWLGSSALCDVIIACGMIYYLRKGNAKFPHTKALVSRLIGLAVGSGLLTAAVAVTDLCLFLIYRHNNYYFTPALCLAKLYSNSLLAQFNFRLCVGGTRNEEVMEAGLAHNLNLNKGTTAPLDILGYQGADTHRRSTGFLGPLGSIKSLRIFHRSGQRIGIHPTRFPSDGISVSITTHRETDGEPTPTGSSATIDVEKSRDQSVEGMAKELHSLTSGESE